MDPTYTLAFLVVFDVILLAGLGYYYRRLGYRFLKYGALALGVEVALQALGYTGVLDGSPVVATVIEAFIRMCYLGLLLACVADIAVRAYPRRLLGIAALLFVAAAFYAGFVGRSSDISHITLLLPSSLLFAWCVYTLLRERHVDGIGAMWFAGLIVMHLGLVWSLPFVDTRSSLIGEILFLDNVVLLFVGVALLMITSEHAIGDLESRDERIEEYVEERRRLELQFSHAQKLESLGVLAGGIAHDFNNMLTSILGYASLAMKKLPNDSEIRKDLYMVMSGARQAVDLTSQMLIYAGKGALEFEAVDISRVADNMSSLMQSIVPRKIQLIQKLARDLPALRGDKVQLGQVLMNLVANAVDAIEDDTGTIEITTGLTDVDSALLRSSFFANDREPGAYLFLRVKDTGIGMDTGQVERIFDPFYSEKQTRKGLGLSSLSGIVRQHAGFIRVRSKPGEGSEFTVYFPVLAYHEEESDGRFLAGLKENVKGSVLLADDDPRIRSLMVSILEGDYFRLTPAEDGKEALRIFEEREGQFDLLVLDCTMPKMSGPDVYKKIRAGGSNVPVLLVSGYHQEQVVANISHDPNAHFIKKPFNVDDFREEVMSALRGTARTVT